MKSLIEVTMLIGQLNRLSVLLQPENGDARWNALQQWIQDNPQEGQRIEEWIAMEPYAAMLSIERFLCDRFDVPVEMLSVFDPLGQIRGKVRTAISYIQELYEERKLQSVVSNRLNP